MAACLYDILFKKNDLKKIVVLIILSFLIKPVFPLIDYAVNYDYISTVLCENKAKPELQCNGKCHLMKELGKNNATDSSQPVDKKTITSEKEILFYVESCRYCNRGFIVEGMSMANNIYVNLDTLLNTHFVFRPPHLLN